MSLLQTFETKLAEVQEQLKTHLGNVHILNGAAQAYSDILNTMKGAGSVIQTVEDVATIAEDAVQVIEGTSSSTQTTST